MAKQHNLFTHDSSETITDVQSSQPQHLIDEYGIAGKVLAQALSTAVNIQTKPLFSYVQWLRTKNPAATPQEIQAKLDKNFLSLAIGSGAGAGAAAAIPGIGFITGALAVGAESLVFLDLAASYAIVSAHLRGIDIRDAERRKAIVLLSIVGASESALANIVMTSDSVTSLAARSHMANLKSTNNMMMKLAVKKINKSMRKAWLGKILPLGIGAVIGTVANRKLAHRVMEHVRESLGALPENFAHELHESA
ncbi:hypothetical membrane protein [Corynebacterium kutscheri]|uniref:hypothetical protein n=1 Tax=Corynebacterium kutscheri TaxID=35755 RepID=UPI000F6F79A0|nr:hypothetical protein [Corynebacterium kutscheri]VEH80098.1 hypothetical membrane protein [Corynebacterium kutscheri]